MFAHARLWQVALSLARAANTLDAALVVGDLAYAHDGK